MKLKVSELFYSAQGEGRFVGVPSVFLRTFGCNFTCSGFGCAPGVKSTEADEVAKNVHLYKDFNSLPLVNTGCDSYASWHPAFKELSPTVDTGQLVDNMLKLTPNNKWIQDNGNDVHLVITGGEPLLGWQRAYEELLSNTNMLDLQNLSQWRILGRCYLSRHRGQLSRHRPPILNLLLKQMNILKKWIGQ